MTTIRRTADLSPCGTYRYSLTREWFAEDGNEPVRWVCFVGCNPSVADADIDDPTIRREMGFAQALGANALIKVNMYAFRATDPAELVRFAQREGDRTARGDGNLRALEWAAALARYGWVDGYPAAAQGLGVFGAWGAMPKPLFASARMIEALGRPLMCLGLTKDGSPRHPLYLKKTVCPMEWRRA